MSTRQESFGFDVFEMAGFTQATVEDFEARERRRKEQELRDELRRARERQARERESRARARSNCYQSPWEVLGVSPGASKRDVRAAWVRLCHENHPDKGGNAETMKRINAAWNSLKGQLR